MSVPLKTTLLNVAATMAGMNFGSEAIFQSCTESGGCDTSLKSSSARKRDQQKLKNATSMWMVERWDGYTTSSFSMLFLIFWVAALIMAIWSAAKFSNWNKNNRIVLLDPKLRGTIVDMISASFALFWMPGVNIVLSSVLTHMVRTARVVVPTN
jgi:hypothetical protein